MRALILFLAMLVAMVAPSAAGVVADYRHLEDGSTIRIEADDKGNARLRYSNQQFYLIVRGGEAFVIYTFTPEPRVTRVSDLEKVFAELPPSMRLETDMINRSRLVPGGTATYAGYSGKAYFLQTPAGRTTRPVLVVSHDPRVRSIGVPLARQFDFSIATVKLAGQAVPPNMLLIRKYIGDGTALMFAGYKLQKVTLGDVDPTTFDLPGPPIPIEELRSNAEAARQRQ